VAIGMILIIVLQLLAGCKVVLLLGEIDCSGSC
jgi:hypothetical protein